MYLLAAQRVDEAFFQSYLAATAYSIKQVDALSYLHQPASLIQLNKNILAIGSEKKFMIPAWINAMITTAAKTSSGNFGAILIYNGSPAYHQWQAGIVYGRKLTKNLATGVRFNYNKAGSPRYEQISTISFQAGTLIQLSPEINLGIMIDNPVGKSIRELKSPTTYRFGLGYRPSSLVLATVEFEKSTAQQININAGIHYIFSSRMWMRVGASTLTNSWWVGSGLLLGRMRLDMITNWHPQLGWSPAIIIATGFKSRNDED